MNCKHCDRKIIIGELGVWVHIPGPWIYCKSFETKAEPNG